MKHRQFNRRDLIKAFGPLGLLMLPVARAMGLAPGGAFAGSPRFVMFFIGGSLHSPSVRPANIDAIGSTMLAPLVPHAKDLVVFQGMSIHGGSPKTDGYQEEHAAGLIGSTTGNSYHYSKNDSYYAYTDNESIDIAIANHYQTKPELKALPIASLHIGAGAHSDADNVGLGQRYISYRKRVAGDALYGNAMEPVQDAGQVYKKLMTSVTLLCGKDSTQPVADNSALKAALARNKSLVDFRLADIDAAKRVLGVDSEHSRKLDGLVDGWRQVEKDNDAAIAAAAAAGGGAVGNSAACPTSAAPTGNGTNKNNCDDLGPVVDQMNGLIKLAFQWDLTRVVAFTLSGASSGQRWPSKGVTQAHHSLEHSNDVKGQVTIGAYYTQKFADLLAALRSIDDGAGQTALYNSTAIMGMECWSDSSNGHYLKDIPFVLGGQGGGAFQTGRVLNAGGRNNNDLLISAQNASGIASSTFGLASLCKGPIV